MYLLRSTIASAALFAGSGVSAATIQIVSGTGQRAVTIASVDPAGQSFTSIDTNLTSFGFLFEALNPAAANDPISFTLRQGEGLNGAIVATRSFTLPGSINSRTPTWYDIDITGTTVTAGAQYTALLSTSGSFRNAIEFGPDINLNTGATLAGDAYAGGRLFGTSNVGGAPCDSGTCDFSFRVTGSSVAAVVPEPATWAMLVGGFGLVGGVARRRTAKRVATA